jgi:hypothetical protein
MAFNLEQAHAVVMVLAWMFFGSTGILFARYGRSLRFGRRRQLFGKAVWFQQHRLLLTFTSVLTLLGFFFILVNNSGTWVAIQDSLSSFVHSIFGGIIVCCTIVQIWLALYRCSPRSRYRYIFNWSHRITGFLAFGLSIPTIYLMVVQLSQYRTVLITIISLWTGWIVLAIFILEKIESKQHMAIAPTVINVRGGGTSHNNTANQPQDTESGNHTNVGNKHLNLIKLILLLMHIIISIILSISFIVIFCIYNIQDQFN